MSEFRRKLMMAYAANKRSDDIVYPGLIAAWSAKGKTNEDVDRDVLKDLTGNGHDITLNGFAFSEMSGYGGYSTEFDRIKWTIADGASLSVKYAKTKVILKPSSSGIFNTNNVRYTSLKSLSLRFKTNINCEITEAININNKWKYTKTPVIANKETLFIAEDVSNIEGLTQRWIYWNAKKESLPQEGLIIELIPEYPDALVFDGVDDYGVNESLPSLTDYTVISKIHWVTSPNAPVYAYGKGKDDVPSSIIFSSYSSIGRDVCYLYNFGIDNNVKSYVNPIINYHNTKVFNGIPIKKGFCVDDNHLFYLGRVYKTHNLCNMAFYSFYLFNRTLTDEEIKSFIRKHIDTEYLLPSEIPIPDCYYDFTNGDNSKGEANNVIKDLSGNGNDATAHNFAWNEESGYAEGRLKFDGVDDYISLDTFDSVFKTMFMVCTNFEAPAGSILYDQRSELFNKNYSVAYYSSSIAYNNDNINGTYINGTLNTKLACQELNNKKHLIHVVAKDISESRKPNIGRSLGRNQYSNMMLYKFLGFKEALTEEQIKAVINKYNLLDGVDNIN